MCETLKQQFYAACPVWFWPVLWWQFVVMERYLARLYAASGRAEITYGLALGPRGELRLVFLSDAARGVAPYTPETSIGYAQALTNPSSNHPCNDISVEQDHAPLLNTLPAFPFYLDPG